MANELWVHDAQIEKRCTITAKEMSDMTDFLLEVVLDGVVIADAPCLARGRNCFRLLKPLTLMYGRNYEFRVVRGDGRLPREVRVIERYRPGDSVNLVGDIEFPA